VNQSTKVAREQKSSRKVKRLCVSCQEKKEREEESKKVRKEERQRGKKKKLKGAMHGQFHEGSKKKYDI